MSLLAVARKDFQDSVRGLWLIVLTVLFVLFAAGLTVVYAEIPFVGGNELSTVGLLIFLRSPAGVLVPIIGLVIGHKAIVGERESGQLKLLLAMPHSRRDAVLGKILGRTATLWVSILIGFLLAAVVVVVQLPNVNLVAYVLFVLITLVFGLAYVSLSVGISSLVDSAGKALALAVTFFVVFEILWGFVPIALAFVANGFQAGPTLFNQPDWARFIGTLSPGAGYSRALDAVLPSLADVLGEQAQQQQQPTDVPFYLEEAFGFVVLLFWLVVPAALGYRQFDRTDLS